MNFFLILIFSILHLFLFLFFQFLFINKWFAQLWNTKLIPLKFHFHVLGEICEGKFSFLCSFLEGIIPFLFLSRRLYCGIT